MTTDDKTTTDAAYAALINTAAAVTGGPELAAAAGDLERREEERRRPDSLPPLDPDGCHLANLSLANIARIDDELDELRVQRVGASHSRMESIERDIDLLSASISFLAAKLGCHDELCDHQRRYFKDLARGVAE